MFEHRDTPLISTTHFLHRLAKCFSLGALFIAVSLLVGVLGYHYTEDMPWIDALLNASMIAGGMGPVDPVRSVAGKLFASVYAIYSGLLLIAVAGFMLAPVMHRILHKFHHAGKSIK